MMKSAVKSSQTTAITTTISELPYEVLELVFGYLSFDDRKRARLVCKRWLDVANSASLTKNDVIVLSNSSDLRKFATNRKHINLRLVNYQKVPQLEKFLQRHHLFVKSIEIAGDERRHYTTINELYSNIALCPNVESLSLGQRYYEDEEVLSIQVKTLVRLTSFELFNERLEDISTFTEDRTILKRFGISFLVDDRKVAKIDNVLAFIAKQAHSLEQIYLGTCQEGLEEIVNMLGSQLKALHLPSEYCSNEGPSPELLMKIANKFPLLEELDLSWHRYLDSIIDNKKINKNDLNSTFSFFENLKFLSLEGTRICDDALITIAASKLLEGLDLSRCDFLTANGFFKAFRLKKHPKLLKLRLNCNDWVTDDLFRRILPYFPNLRCLYLNDCYNLTSEGISSIASNCTMLSHLSLKSCANIKSLMEHYSINDLKHLTFLSLEKCVNLSRESLALLKLPDLQVLNLAALGQVTNDLLVLLLNNCPNLRTFYLAKNYFECKRPTLSRMAGKRCNVTANYLFEKQLSVFQVFNSFRKRHDIDSSVGLKVEFY